MQLTIIQPVIIQVVRGHVLDGGGGIFADSTISFPLNGTMLIKAFQMV